MSILKGKSKLLLYREMAEQYLQKMKTTEYTSADRLHEDLYAFVLCKYLLYGDDTEGVFSLDELAERSVAKTIQMTGQDAFKADSKVSCEGTTSAMNKKVLLLMALQRELGITFDVSRTADLTDTRLLAEEVFGLLAEKNHLGRSNRV